MLKVKGLLLSASGWGEFALVSWAGDALVSEVFVPPELG